MRRARGRLFWRLHRGRASERVVIKRSALATRRELVFGARASRVYLFSPICSFAHNKYSEQSHERETRIFYLNRTIKNVARAVRRKCLFVTPPPPREQIKWEQRTSESCSNWLFIISMRTHTHHSATINPNYSLQSANNGARALFQIKGTRECANPEIALFQWIISSHQKHTIIIKKFLISAKKYEWT